MHSIKVRTTQNVFITYPIASLGDRILAFLLDYLILVAYSVFILALFINMEMDVAWVWGVSLGLPWLFYHLLFEVFMNGQSPGKRVMSIKVVRLDGTPATIGNYIMRWVFAFIDFYILSGLVAVLAIAVGGKGQRLGDMVAGTSVVKPTAQSGMAASEIFVTPGEGYVPTFGQVIQLTENDIALVQRALEVNRDQGNAQPVMEVTERIKSLLGIQSDLPPVKFLYTIIKDFNHITSK
ncbi:MAG: RDD family protein [Cyclobacteriaceae bacterium]|nr:RDD family protein [Cyclobacteriaceae bacterium]MCB0498910.1 RDD family protein [Cyclobacteriaceae bacterium]MCB9237576.1 RDD family protein [Flammeovirgaceae bacterium]MCO5270322.1 RDD family protein [Cyclobacteriaceae bacterium]MCW5902298.1 RDD family protein [Cyclobacteriaceae bacterium]